MQGQFNYPDKLNELKLPRINKSNLALTTIHPLSLFTHANLQHENIFSNKQVRLLNCHKNIGPILRQFFVLSVLMFLKCLHVVDPLLCKSLVHQLVYQQTRLLNIILKYTRCWTPTNSSEQNTFL